MIIIVEFEKLIGADLSIILIALKNRQFRIKFRRREEFNVELSRFSKMARRADDNDPYPYQIDEKARDENMAKLIIPARKRANTLKELKSPILNTVNDNKDSRPQIAAETL